MPETTPIAPDEALALRDWLRELKDASGLSYSDIARSIGEEERNVKRWMAERNPVVPRGDALLRCLNTLGVTFNPPAPAAVGASLAGELRQLRNAYVHGLGGILIALPEPDRSILQEYGGGATVDELAEHYGETREAMLQRRPTSPICGSGRSLVRCLL